LEAHRDEVKSALDARQDVDEADRVVLSALLGLPVDEVVLAILELSPSFRPGVISRLIRLDGMAPLLPWDDWLEEAPELRSALASLGAGAEARAVYKALAACVGPGDDALFRAAVSHPDWQVRLAAAEVLGRFSRPGNLIALTRLAADSVPAVAHRALSALE